VGVVDVQTGEESTLLIRDFHPRVEATLFVGRPEAYVIPPALTDVLEVLDRHRIPMTVVDTPFSTEAEIYRILGVEAGRKEDKDFLDVRAQVRREQRRVPAGHVLVPTAGIHSNLVVSLLEPQSQWGLAPLPDFADMLQAGSDYPILRLVSLPD
jgi:hypothetical protein